MQYTFIYFMHLLCYNLIKNNSSFLFVEILLSVWISLIMFNKSYTTTFSLLIILSSKTSLLTTLNHWKDWKFESSVGLVDCRCCFFQMWDILLAMRECGHKC